MHMHMKRFPMSAMTQHGSKSSTTTSKPIAAQMGITLQKTARSINVKERLDFSCAIFNRQGQLIVNAPHIPVHLGAMGETVRRIIADNPDMGPGDVFVTNDPYRGGSHLPDITVITPVYSTPKQVAAGQYPGWQSCYSSRRIAPIMQKLVGFRLAPCRRFPEISPRKAC